MKDEQLKLSKDFKRAYNHADLLISQMPHILEGIQPAKDESSEYTNGFNARLKLWDMERDAVKKNRSKNILSKYGKGPSNKGKDLAPQKKEKDKGRDKD